MQTRAAGGSQNVLCADGKGVCTNEKILLFVLTTVEAEVINSCNFLLVVSGHGRNNGGNVCQNWCN